MPLNLVEECISSEIIASGGMLTVKCDQVRLPNGHVGQREYVIHPGAVVVVPMLANGHIVLERQFRYPLGRVFIELPAGKIDAGEDTLTTGQRELLEETGYQASHWVKLGAVHPCIGYSNEVIYVYLAYRLHAGKHRPDEDESLEIFEQGFTETLDQIQSGEITDAKTIAALFLAERYIRNNPL